MRKVDDKRVHKGLMPLAIGAPSGSDARMMGLLKLIDVGERFANEPAQRIAIRDHPLPDPSMTCGRGSRGFLGKADKDRSGDGQRKLLVAVTLSIIKGTPMSEWGGGDYPSSSKT